MIMSIKILYISETKNNELEKAYAHHIENGVFKFFSPQDMDNEIHYDIILAEEEYIPILQIKSIPIIILKASNSKIQEELYPYFIFFSQPINWQNLYDQIISLQYMDTHQSLTMYHTPEVKQRLETPLITKEENSIEVIEKSYQTSNINNINTNNKSMEYPSKEHMEKSYRGPNKLSTKIFNYEDCNNIIKVLNRYGYENLLDEKVIAQASIILDELIFVLKNLQQNYPVTNVNDPKVLLSIDNNNGYFHMNIECRITLPEFDKILQIAKDYGSIVQSFERNNSHHLDIEWYI